MLIRQLRHVYQKGNITDVSFAFAIDTNCIVFAESYLYVYLYKYLDTPNLLYKRNTKRGFQTTKVKI